MMNNICGFSSLPDSSDSSDSSVSSFSSVCPGSAKPLFWVASFLGLTVSVSALTSQVKAQDVVGATVAEPSDRLISGVTHGIPWTVNSLLVGTTSNAPVASGGNAIYLPTMPRFSGVASLLISKGASNTFICTGSLLNDRRSILTAAHCVSDGLGNLNATSATAFFYDGSMSPPYQPDTIVHSSSAATGVSISNFFIAPGYSGKPIEDNDLAVLRLSGPAPSFARSYELYLQNPRSSTFDLSGYGLTSNSGGSVGANGVIGRLRQGSNRYDFQWKDPNFNGEFLSDPLFADGLNTWISDFDSGLAANDVSCRLSTFINPSLAGNPIYCNLGTGTKEATVARSDSGSPGFIGDQIATIVSYATSLGTSYGDIDNISNATFGEISGHVPVALNASFIASVKVPAPLPIVGVASLVAWSRRLRRRMACASLSVLPTSERAR